MIEDCSILTTKNQSEDDSNIISAKSSSIRGIINISGTACHLSSSLILLCHSLHPIQSALQILSNQTTYFVNDGAESASNYDILFLQELLSFLEELCNPSSSDALNPTQFYQNIKKYIGLEAQDLGDAVNALLKLLQQLNISLNKMELQVFEQFKQRTDIKIDRSYVNVLFYSGEVYSTIIGKKYEKISCAKNPDHVQYRLLTRSKRFNFRALSNPLVVPIASQISSSPTIATTSSLSLVDLLKYVLQNKQVLDGYKWTGEYEVKDDLISCNIKNSICYNQCDHWTTTKLLNVTSFPPILMLHLQWFNIISSLNGHRLVPVKLALTIPERIDLSAFYSDEKQSSSKTLSSPGMKQSSNLDGETDIYELTGGILHVDDKDDSSEEGGHYVAVVRKSMDGSNHQWFLVDDEKVEAIDQNVVFGLLGGKTRTCSSENSESDSTTCDKGILISNSLLQNGNIYRGVLLVYQKLKVASTIDHLLEEMKKQFSNVSFSKSNCNESMHPNEKDSEIRELYKNPDNLVGKRLRVKWAKGNYFSGVVDSYDAVTGKHRVRYDDGDFKEYRLHKKTIIWDT